jgi:enterochelin esterase family protein
VSGPAVSEDVAVLSLADGRYSRVALAHELRRPRLVPFRRTANGWELRLERPPVDRLEYLLELEHGDGRVERVPDPDNPLRAPGAFGEKSVLEYPEYESPGWVADEDSQTGELRTLPLPSWQVMGWPLLYSWGYLWFSRRVPYRPFHRRPS